MVRVLLVEPDKLLAETYMKAFKKSHLSARWQSTAQGSVTFIDKYHPKVIVLELQLAHHNGVEFLYELRSHSDWQNIPVILHTIIPETELGLNDEVRKQLGIVGYLYKPQTTIEQLLQEIHATLGK